MDQCPLNQLACGGRARAFFLTITEPGNDVEIIQWIFYLCDPALPAGNLFKTDALC